MTDPATGSELVPVPLPGGGERHLKRLAPADWLRLSNTLRATRRAEMLADLAAEGASPEAVAAELAKFRERPKPRHSDIVNFVDKEYPGQYAVIMLSLAQDHPLPPRATEADVAAATQAAENEFASFDLPMKFWRGLAIPLIGLTFVDSKKNLPDGATTSPTSGASPTESGTPSTPPTTP